jgi:tRNA threonylcarbamoyladenosine biosynthesis protein TsaE
MSGREVVHTGSEDETSALGARVAAGLPPGSVVLLTGDLGAGKTAFVRGMAAGLDLDPDEVSSPTFTLVQEYRPSTRSGRPERSSAPPRPTLYHVDLYRLEGGEVEDLGLEELVAGGGIVAIEWAEKLPQPLEGAVRVEIEDLGDDRRAITISKGRGRGAEGGER